MNDGTPVASATGFNGSGSASGVASRKGRQDTSRAQLSQLLYGHVGYATRGAGEVAGGGEVQNPNYRGDGIAGIAEQLGGAGYPVEIDHPLEIRRATCPELSRQMFATDP